MGNRKEKLDTKTANRREKPISYSGNYPPSFLVWNEKFKMDRSEIFSFDQNVASYYKFSIFEAAGRNLHLKIYNVFIK